MPNDVTDGAFVVVDGAFVVVVVDGTRVVVVVQDASSLLSPQSLPLSHTQESEMHLLLLHVNCELLHGQAHEKLDHVHEHEKAPLTMEDENDPPHRVLHELESVMP